MTSGGGVDILNTGHGKNLLEDGSGDNTSTTRSSNQTDTDGTALTSDLDGDGVGLAGVETPIASTDGDDVHLGGKDGTSDGGGDFLSALGAHTDVTVEVTDGDEGLETGSLTGSGLLLDREDLHDLFLKVGEELIDNFGLLDGEGVEEDLLDGGDLSLLDETAELGDGGPLSLGIGGLLGARATTTGSTLLGILG